MPATLMSFDLVNGMSVPSRENITTRALHPTYLSRPLPKNKNDIEALNHENDEEFDDISFDDTRIETPKAIRKNKNHNLSQSSIDGSPIINKSRYAPTVKTTKIPLKDDDTVSRSKKTSIASNAVSRTMSSLSSNDTALHDRSSGAKSKLPSLHKVTDDRNTWDDDEEEAEIIRNSQIISEDNKFQPNKASIPIFGNKSSARKGQFESILASSPSKLTSRSSQQPIHTTKAVAAVASTDLDDVDIEFDSSESEHEGRTYVSKHPDTRSIHGRDKTSPTPIKRLSRKVDVASQDFQGSIKGNGGSDIEDELNKARGMDIDEDEQLKQKILSDLPVTEEIVEQMYSNISSLEKKDLRSDSEEEEEGTKPVAQIGYSSSDSASDRETHKLLDEVESSWSNKDRAARSGALGVNRQRFGSLHSDGHVRPAQNNHFKKSYPQSDPSYASNLSNIRRGRPISKRSSPVKNVEDDILGSYALPKKHFPNLSGQYARHVLKQRRENPALHSRPNFERTYSVPGVTPYVPPPNTLVSSNGGPNIERAPVTQIEGTSFRKPARPHNASNPSDVDIPKHDKNDEVDYPDWSDEKWSKLQSLVHHPYIPREAILASDLVKQGLDVGVEELNCRLDYLYELKRVWEIKKSKKRSKRRHDTQNGKVAKKTTSKRTK